MTNRQMKQFVNSLTSKQRERFLAELLASMPLPVIQNVIKQTLVNETKEFAKDSIAELIDSIKF